MTRRAVERLQKRSELIVNGVVDPPTWQVLREAASRWPRTTADWLRRFES
ncbi:peptidoglycan-binding protein [Streptomyces sp. NPDC048305]